MDLEKDINRCKFFIFILIWNISIFWAASYKNPSNPPTLRQTGLFGHKPQSLLPNQTPKML
jgi:hypothetical protein